MEKREPSGKVASEWMGTNRTNVPGKLEVERKDNDVAASQRQAVGQITSEGHHRTRMETRSHGELHDLQGKHHDAIERTPTDARLKAEKNVHKKHVGTLWRDNKPKSSECLMSLAGLFASR